jgi:hypothetical protein
LPSFLPAGSPELLYETFFCKSKCKYFGQERKKNLRLVFQLTAKQKLPLSVFSDTVSDILMPERNGRELFPMKGTKCFWLTILLGILWLPFGVIFELTKRYH